MAMGEPRTRCGRSHALSPDHRGQDAIDNLYRDELRRALPQIAARLERKMGVHATQWSIRTMKTRWVRAPRPPGAIRINARLAAYPPECLEFVVAHELVHLLEPSHNARFHALLDEFCPDNRLSPSVSGKAPFRLTRKSGAITTTDSRQNRL